MKNFIKIFFVTILGFNIVCSGAHLSAPQSPSRAGSPESDDSLDGLVGNYRFDKHIKFSEEGDSLDDLFDQVNGAKKVDQQEYNSDVLDGLIGNFSGMKRSGQKDLTQLDQTYFQRAQQRENLLNAYTNLLTTDNEDSHEAENLLEQIKNISHSMAQILLSKKHLEELQNR